MKKTIIGAWLPLLVSCWCVDAAADQAQSLAASCSSCHARSSEPSVSVGIPALTGLSSAQLLSKLMAYRQDEIAGTLMNRIAKGYSPAELAAIADTITKE
jgi:sulfide dehydrogenase cytochrome subunit